jgi:hypothetical protein
MSARRRTAGRFLVGWLGSVLCVTLHAAQTVSPCTEASLDAALSAGGRITFACDGVLLLRSTKVITVDTLLDAGDRQVTLSGGQSNRLFIIEPGVTLTLQGLTLTGGHHQGAPGRTRQGDHGGAGQPGLGGAILNLAGTLVAINTRFTTNLATGGNGGNGSAGAFFGAHGRNAGSGGAALGGAIWNDGGSLFLTNCTFIANRATGGLGGTGGNGASGTLNGDGGNGGNGGSAFGGAIANRNQGLLVSVNCSFSDNGAIGQPGGEAGFAGGGMSFDGLDGQAGSAHGGAIHGSTGQTTLLNSTLNLNRVQGANGLHALGGRRAQSGRDGGTGGAASGGAVAIHAGALLLTNTTLHANRVLAGDGGEGGQGGTLAFGGHGGDGGRGGSAVGGGLALSSMNTSLVNSTLADNQVTGGQGGIGGNPGTFVRNHGSPGATGFASGAHSSNHQGELRLVNVLFARGSGAGNSAGLILDLGHNLSSDSTPALTHPSSRNDLDPMLSGILSNHGGPTRTLALLPGSPAIDAADSAAAPRLDQRGFVRVGPADIGAYEFGGESPGLAIHHAGNQVQLSWPVALTGYRLQVSPSLTSPAWTDAPAPEVVNFHYVVTLPLLPNPRFYRLTRE